MKKTIEGYCPKYGSPVFSVAWTVLKVEGKETDVVLVAGGGGATKCGIQNAVVRYQHESFVRSDFVVRLLPDCVHSGRRCNGQAEHDRSVQIGYWLSIMFLDKHKC